MPMVELEAMVSGDLPIPEAPGVRSVVERLALSDLLSK
jgi:hypothetical protein